MLLEEEMRRSLAYCLWRSSWWKLLANRRIDVSPNVAEGLTAYAVEQSRAEQERALRWTSQWSQIRERAQVILNTQLSGVETQVPIPQLVIELEDEDERDDEDELDGDDEE